MPRITWAGMDIPEHVYHAIQRGQRRFLPDELLYGKQIHVPDALVLSIIHHENHTYDCSLQSHYPDASGPNGREDSWGLMQLNRQGEGAGIPLSDLQDCTTNVGIGIRAIARLLGEGKTYYEALAPWKGVRDFAWSMYEQNPSIYVDGKPSENQTPPNRDDKPRAIGKDVGDWAGNKIKDALSIITIPLARGTTSVLGVIMVIVGLWGFRKEIK